MISDQVLEYILDSIAVSYNSQNVGILSNTSLIIHTQNPHRRTWAHTNTHAMCRY